jgi:hypothetical protein
MGKVNWFWLNKTVEKLKSSTLQPAETVAVIPASTNLPTVAGTFADLAAARTAVEAQRAGAEPRLDALETKVNEIITKLKTAGIIL